MKYSKPINLLKVYLLRFTIASAVTLMTLYVIEAILNHYNGLPFNGYKDGICYTWGKPIHYNSFGFRDDEWKTESSKYRVMVLGDSFTWGVGLDNSQRFTELCEDNEIEVMNFGASGYDFTDYYLVLGDYFDLFEPDLVVVAYCINDTQIHQTNYSPQRESWERKYRNKYNKVFSTMSLDEVGKYVDRSLCRLAEKTGVFPGWIDALDATYQMGSTGWQMTIKSLYDIKSLCDVRSIPVVFFTLNHGIHYARGTDYSNPGKKEKKIMSWWHQAERLAGNLGYHVVNIEDALIASGGKIKMGINKKDNHPSDLLNIIYANRLKPIINEYKDGWNIAFASTRNPFK